MPAINDLTLPKLPYELTALEPYISSKIMDLHYNKHHAGYLKKLQAGLSQTEYASKNLEDLFSNLSLLPEDIALVVKRHGGGYWNHTFFWEVLSPSSPDIPENLEASLKESFESLDAFKEQFEQKGLSVFGSGWVWLVKASNGLEIVTTPNQENPLMFESPRTPVFGVDVWEHAYYLDYYNERGKYLSSLWNIVNWEKVNDLLQSN